ncbi:MAG: S8 family serine peptidase [Candidatus Margulisiibacteriota bacterium]
MKNTTISLQIARNTFIKAAFVMLLSIAFPLLSINASFSLTLEEQRNQMHKEALVKNGNTRKPVIIEKYFDKITGKYVDVAAGQVLVKLKPRISVQSLELLNKKNNTNSEHIANTGILRVSAKAENIRTVDSLIQTYKNDPNVEYCEPNYIRKKLSAALNDTYYSLQWGLPQISAPLGWDIEKGSADVVIAVIDTGMSFDHEDLINKQWINPGEWGPSGSYANNGIDDDGNGYVDDSMGWDFARNDKRPLDFDGHGTHVSGIAAAENKNSKGIAGVAWNNKIMALCIFGDSDNATVADECLALYYAANNGAKVINLSLGSPGYSNAENTAIQYAHGKGCVIVAAAGNDGNSTLYYPASYSNVISVASVDKNDLRSPFSNYNSYVDVCAPGGYRASASDQIYSSCMFWTGDKYISNLYTYLSGTSMSAPFVSGLAALLLSQNPAWTNAQVENKIFSSADDLGPEGRDNYFGYGRINVYKALNTVPSTPKSFTAKNGKTDTSLSWVANTASDLAGYKIYRANTSSEAYSLIYTASSTMEEYQDPCSKGGYYYKICAYDLGGLESPFSDIACAATDDTLPEAGNYDISRILIYPNPFTGSTSGVTFDLLKGDEVIRIYTINGELVTSSSVVGSSNWLWNVTNLSGNPVARGIYLFVITNGSGQKRAGKIAVVY